MTFLQLTGITSGILAFIAYIPYVRDMLKGNAKPERASWLIWLVLACIAFFSQLAEGATDSLWLTGLDSIGALIIFLLAIKYGMGGFTKRDKIALAASAVGLLLWGVTQHAIIALCVTILVDLSATTLTVLKTYEEPKSETYPMWIIVSIAALLGMVAVGSLSVVLLIYPFYIFLANVAVIVAKVLGSRRKIRH